MADISKITTTNGTTYNIKDATARELIADLQAYTDYLGVTTTALTDGATTNPIKIDGENVTAVKGNIVNYNAAEFIFNGTAWQLFGDLSGLGSLAFKNSATGTITPRGSVSQPTFAGTEGNISVSGTVADSVTLAGYSATGTGRVDITPAGTVSQPSFNGTEGNVSVSGTPTGNITLSKGTGTANYTPEGNITVNNPTVTLNTTNVPNVTAVGSLPTLTTSVQNETLSFSFSQGALPTLGNPISVATSVKSATANGGSFSGTGAELKATFNGTSFTSTGKFTPNGTVTQPTFNGTSKYIGATVGTATKTMTGKFTPAGTVSQPTFSGTEGTVTVS